MLLELQMKKPSERDRLGEENQEKISSTREAPIDADPDQRTPTPKGPQLETQYYLTLF